MMFLNVRGCNNFFEISIRNIGLGLLKEAGKKLG